MSLLWKCVGISELDKSPHYYVHEQHIITGSYRTRRMKYDDA